MKFSIRRDIAAPPPVLARTASVFGAPEFRFTRPWLTAKLLAAPKRVGALRLSTPSPPLTKPPDAPRPKALPALKFSVAPWRT